MGWPHVLGMAHWTRAASVPGFQIKAAESETELRVHFIQSIISQYLQSKWEKEERPQTGPSISALSKEDKQEEKDSSFPRLRQMSSTRSSFSLFPDSWGILQGALKAAGMQVLITALQSSEGSIWAHGVFQP